MARSAMTILSHIFFVVFSVYVVINGNIVERVIVVVLLNIMFFVIGYLYLLATEEKRKGVGL